MLPYLQMSSWYFEPFTVPLNSRTRVESIFWTASALEQFSLSKLAERLKDSHFFLYLPIENPSKRPGTSPGGKLKSHSFWKVKMSSKIYTCQPENCPADCLVNQMVLQQLVLSRLGKRLLFNGIQSKRDDQQDGFWLAHVNLVMHFDSSKTVRF